MRINEDLLFREIGKRLKTKRKEEKLTQAELAKAAGVLRTSVTNLEAGKQKVPLPVVYELCTALGIDIMELLPSIERVLNKEISPSVEIGGRSKFVPEKSANIIKKYSKVD
ncbi:MAG: helix-turn-helix domain-containing protein [Cyanobacteria bacterium P01_D01_bin.6]